MIPDRLLPVVCDENGNVLKDYDESLGWLESGPGEQNKFGEWKMTFIYHPYSQEQLDSRKREKDKADLEETRRQLTVEEAMCVFLKAQANTVDIPDQTSLRMMSYYPKFEEIVGTMVKLGFKFVYGEAMYKTIQPDLLIQSHYPPGVGTESLYVKIDVEHTGADYDPIPYSGNMSLENGKYYSQGDALYLCDRDTEVAVQHALTDLIGLYVKKT